MLIISGPAQDVLLEKRPQTGIWSGLWVFPQIDPALDPVAYCADTLRLDVALQERWSQYRHTFSHYHLDIEPVRLQLRAESNAVMEAERHLWYNLRAPAEIGLAAPVAKLLQKLA